MFSKTRNLNSARAPCLWTRCRDRNRSVELWFMAFRIWCIGQTSDSPSRQNSALRKGMAALSKRRQVACFSVWEFIDEGFAVSGEPSGRRGDGRRVGGCWLTSAPAALSPLWLGEQFWIATPGVCAFLFNVRSPEACACVYSSNHNENGN